MTTAKVKRYDNQSGTLYGYGFTCPGCKHTHLLPVGVGDGHTHARWEFNGDLEAPTFSPSILAQWENRKGKRVCHSFVKAGQIQFLNDCTHELAGQTVPLPPCAEDDE